MPHHPRYAAGGSPVDRAARPTEGVIAAALNIRSDSDWLALRTELHSLVSNHVLIERRYASEYQLAQGSDFDVLGAIEDEAERLNEHDVALAPIANRELPLPSYVARRHAIETGTVRIVSREFSDARAISKESIRQSLDWKEINARPELVISYVLAFSNEDVAHCLAAAREHSTAQTIFVVPSVALRVRDHLLEMEATRHVLALSELEHDAVARWEAQLHLVHLQDAARAHLQNLLDPASGGSVWIWCGQTVTPQDERAVQALSSRICDEVFNKSPHIVNELINRRKLSTATVVAVKQILSKLLASRNRDDITFKGNGPDVSIFNAVFQRTGWFADDVNSGVLHKPSDQSVVPSWEWIRNFLESSATEQRALCDLWDELSQAPFGIHAGLAPLMIWASMIENVDSYCLYERGTFIPQWSAEVFDRFLRRPQDFSVRCLTEKNLSAIISTFYKSILPVEHTGGGELVKLAPFLRDLYRWYRTLPDFTRRTRSLSRQAQSFRQLLTTAVDPVSMLIEELPEALGYAGATEKRLNSNYRRALQSIVGEMSGAYDALLAHIVNRLSALLGVPADAQAIKSELLDLAAGITPTIPSTARGLLLRAQEDIIDESAWVESIAASLVGQGPRHWTDESLGEFEGRAALEIHNLRQRQRAYWIQVSAGLDVTTQARWVQLISPGKISIDSAVPMGRLTHSAGEALREAENQLRARLSTLNPSERKQVLTELLHTLWEDHADD